MPPRRLFAAEVIEEAELVVEKRSWPFRLWGAIGRGIEWYFGLACLLVGLAVVASVPVAQFISLGYLLEVSGRISRSGRLREGFLGIRQAARVGSLLIGTWVMLLPLRLIADLKYSAELINGEGWTAVAWQAGLVIATWFMLAHILLACYCGGRLRHFIWPLLAPVFFAMWIFRHLISNAADGSLMRPILERMSPRLLRDLTNVPKLTEWFPPAIAWQAFRRGSMYSEARDRVWDFLVGLRVPYYFWLGLRGFAGAVAWLFVPILMIIATTKLQLDDEEAARGLGAVIGLFGSFLLAFVILYLPFLQSHFAAENRMVAVFEFGEVRRLFRRAPVAFWFALLTTLLFALPLYLLKVAVIPREVVWLPSLVFIMFIFPARLITGWALGRARQRVEPRFFLMRWLARLGGLPVVAIYVFIVYFTQYTSWYGSWSLFEQHAFLMPVPFLSL